MCTLRRLRATSRNAFDREFFSEEDDGTLSRTRVEMTNDLEWHLVKRSQIPYPYALRECLASDEQLAPLVTFDCVRNSLDCNSTRQQSLVIIGSR